MGLKRSLVPFVAGLALLVTVMPRANAEGVTAESMFERAETLYRQLDTVDPAVAEPDPWNAVAMVFAAIPDRFPTHPLAGHALWRLGEIRVREHRAGMAEARPQAVAAYELLASRYPTSRFAPAAYLRLGEIGTPAEQQTHYYRLLQRYPGTDEADEARRRLASGVVTPPSAERANAEVPVDRAPRRTDPATETAANRPTDADAGEGRAAPFGTDNEPTDEVLEASPTPASRTSPSARGDSTVSRVPQPLDLAADADLGQLTGVRHYSDSKVTRVVFDLDRAIAHEIGEAQGPPRIFVDLIGARLPAELPRVAEISGTGVDRVRIGVNRPGVVRLVLDLEHQARYSFFTLSDPHRLVVDIPNAELSERIAGARRPPAPEGGAEGRQLSLGIRRVVIDPGHGGTAPGAIGRSGVTEKELTLDIANRLVANLESSGYEVLLTRDGDESVDLEERPRFATQAGADLFVSIHVNSSTNRRLSGFETYYLDLATDPTAAETAARENAAASSGLGNLDHLLDEIVKNANKRESRDLAHSIQDSLVLQMTRRHDDIRDLGVKHAPFLVLVGAQMPAVLVECSFLSHEGEETRLRDPDYRQSVADAIHIGIENFSAKRRMITATH